MLLEKNDDLKTFDLTYNNNCNNNNALKLR